ncbi:YfiT family bacillithiol transferase [Marinoscillum sp. MHG1-6]|uniref:YfiT family bacillithiol transferase n=1 Tax=Marinoscillum sp. MHG1-6 TaxID=2959627 RepID=UPI00215849F4|nr:putative metal-dependent hydrolase [Marinoscillum sp. MHG1-6]
MELEALKYPIGQFETPAHYSQQLIQSWIHDIGTFPSLLTQTVESLAAEQLEWKYRPSGWCIRQVVHHCADSHLNSIVRFKLALTEDNPTIKPYEEALWAELPDMNSPIEWSLILLEGLHKRWVALLENLSSEDLERVFTHPEQRKTFTVWQIIANYSWHCRHHLAHVNQAIEAKGKY